MRRRGHRRVHWIQQLFASIAASNPLSESPQPIVCPNRRSQSFFSFHCQPGRWLTLQRGDEDDEGMKAQPRPLKRAVAETEGAITGEVEALSLDAAAPVAAPNPLPSPLEILEEIKQSSALLRLAMTGKRVRETHDERLDRLSRALERFEDASVGVDPTVPTLPGPILRSYGELTAQLENPTRRYDMAEFTKFAETVRDALGSDKMRRYIKSVGILNVAKGELTAVRVPSDDPPLVSRSLSMNLPPGLVLPGMNQPLPVIDPPHSPDEFYLTLRLTRYGTFLVSANAPYAECLDRDWYALFDAFVANLGELGYPRGGPSGGLTLEELLPPRVHDSDDEDDDDDEDECEEGASSGPTRWRPISKRV